jgi:hypothetical protein
MKTSHVPTVFRIVTGFHRGILKHKYCKSLSCCLNEYMKFDVFMFDLVFWDYLFFSLLRN